MIFGKRYALLLPLASLTAGLLFTAGCKKEDGFENNNVVRTPYSLFFASSFGTFEGTNDGVKFKIYTAGGDGLPFRALITSGQNILRVQYNPVLRHAGQDVGILKPGENSWNIKATTLNPIANWQSMILDVPGDAVYIASTVSPGIEVSYDNGLTFTADIQQAGFDFTRVSSFTQTRDGKVYALDNATPQIFDRNASKQLWGKQNPTGLPTGGFYLSHINNTLLAGDHNGSGGVYFSGDRGVTWAQYAGLDAGQQVLSLHAPFDQVVLAGMDSVGIYRLVINQTDPTQSAFVASNNGLEPYTSVYGIIGKQNIFKNDVIKQYVYIATNKGLYRSEDLGQNWTKVRNGDYRVVY